MKRIILLSLMITGLLCGCQTSREQVVFNSLASVAYTVDSSFKGYVDLVVAGKLPTETLPKVGAAYTSFQTAFNAALAVAQFSKSSIAPQNVIDAASVVLNSISQAKGAIP